MSREIVVIAHNIRSVYNVGSIFRTCEGFGVKKLYLSGYTPAPGVGLPHVARKVSEAVHKTALGAEEIVPFEYTSNIFSLLEELRHDSFSIIGLEQDKRSVNLRSFRPPEKLALILGEEVNGIALEIRDKCDTFVEIPMHGRKESFNVSVATGIVLYALAKSL